MVSIIERKECFTIKILKPIENDEKPLMFRPERECSINNSRYREIYNFFKNWKINSKIYLNLSELEMEVKERHGCPGSPGTLQEALEYVEIKHI